MPKGIVIIRMKATTPARAYRIAIHQPHSTSQITFRITFVTHHYPLSVDYKLAWIELRLARVLMRVLVDCERFEQAGGRGRDLLDRGVEHGRVARGRGP